VSALHAGDALAVALGGVAGASASAGAGAAEQGMRAALLAADVHAVCPSLALERSLDGGGVVPAVVEVRQAAPGPGQSPGAGAGAAFSAFTGFPPDRLLVDPDPQLHRALGLYEGLRQFGGPWPNLMLMCAGLGSPGTLAEVLRGYTGDRSAPQLLADDETIQAGPLPPLQGSFFARAGGSGFQRPFELATIRLRNMAEVLGHWRTYVPRDDYLTQRGGTFLLDADDSLLYVYRDRGILGFSETMARPLSFLDPFLGLAELASGARH
jgi:hypothetical protein